MSVSNIMSCTILPLAFLGCNGGQPLADGPTTRSVPPESVVTGAVPTVTLNADDDMEKVLRARVTLDLHCARDFQTDDIGVVQMPTSMVEIVVVHACGQVAQYGCYGGTGRAACFREPLDDSGSLSHSPRESAPKAQ